MAILSVEIRSEHPTITFAGEELERYFQQICQDNEDIKQNRPFRIEIGLFSQLLPDRPHNANPFDDAIYFEIRQGNGIIAGINPRSCLLAVYRLLREAGCRFLRPGPDGEIVPLFDWAGLNLSIDETPSYRHRGLCIEGAVSREIFLSIIDWLPKNGMNAYFIQFREAYTFFDRYYDHKNNPFLDSEKKSVQAIREIISEGIASIRKRDLIYHAVGHGWTCEPFGISGLGWEEVEQIPDGASRFFAEIAGKRELYHGVPLNTNLCYGNQQVQQIIVDSIAEYSAAHHDVDLLHFWLADGSNNHCECSLCAEIRPADFYIQMLNQVDQRLTELNLATRIVFLVYVDLLWAPEKETLNNPDRFVLMFAPITRSYSRPFSAGHHNAENALPPYNRNKLTFPSSPAQNIDFLAQWQSLNSCDSFDFDYHMMWSHYRDPGHEQLLNVLYQDIRNLAGIGLNGLISCQVQRAFFPTPLLMQIMAQTLWQKESDFEELANSVYLDTFGQHGLAVRVFLSQISTLFDPVWLRLEKPLVNPERSSQLVKIKPLLNSFALLVESQLDLPDQCQRQSWFLLKLFLAYAGLLAEYCLALAEGDAKQAEAGFDQLKQWIFENEPQLMYTFDSEIASGELSRLYKSLLQH